MQLIDDIEQKYAKYLLYAVLIPVFGPRGFSECWSWYKAFFTLCLYPALAVMVVWIACDLIRRGCHYKLCGYAVAVYYLLFILITLVVQGGISDGLQKLFAAPVIMLFCMMCLKNNTHQFLRVLGNILLAILGLNITVFSPALLKVYSLLGNRLFFLGHIQVAAQYGILSILVAAILHIAYKENAVYCVSLAGVSLVTMLWSNTDAGILVVLLMVLAFVFWMIRKPNAILSAKRALTRDPRMYLVGYLLMTEVLLLYAIGQHYVFWGIDLSFNGRTIVWTEVLRLFAERPIFGYGAYGVLIHTFWTEGMNYAHSEFMQKLLDGGIALCIAYYFVLATLIAPVRKVKSMKARYVAIVCLTGMFLVMFFESVGDYFYASVFFVILAYYPEIFGERLKKAQSVPIADGGK